MAETIKHRRERIEKETLYEIGYKYLCDNFHKFKEQNKIKVALAILSIFEKDGSKTPNAAVILMPVIQKSGEASLENLEFKIGTPRITEDAGHSGEDSSLN